MTARTAERPSLAALTTPVYSRVITQSVRPEKAESRQIRILIADNHTVFREGLRHLLEAELDFVVVGQAADGAQALKLTIALQPDILLLDVAMPKMSGLEAMRRLAKIQTNTKIILVTAGDTRHTR
ncbi:MAG: hypothetical protein DMG11_15835 [Acidobacteria bacterium]|nr:MAG: hypothetical protein DMG11_15835 [Acidobacteriota bacterium]